MHLPMGCIPTDAYTLGSEGNSSRIYRQLIIGPLKYPKLGFGGV